MLFEEIQLFLHKKQWIMIKDNFDIKILNLLQKNSRLSFVQIGKDIGLSPTAVAERIKRLEDNDVIVNYSVAINLQKIGYSLSAFISIKFHVNKLKKFEKDITNFPEIMECHRITGSDCLIMKLHLRDSFHLEKVIDKLIIYGDPSTSIILSSWDVSSNRSLSLEDPFG